MLFPFLLEFMFSIRESTEIVNLETRYAPRSRVLPNVYTDITWSKANPLGGLRGNILSIYLRTVEEWEAQTKTWQERELELGHIRSDCGAGAVENSLVCG